MKYAKLITDRDRALVADKVKDFLPDEIFDIHAHLYHSDHFPAGTFSFLRDEKILDFVAYEESLRRYMPVKKLHALHFGMPHKTADRRAINEWLGGETRTAGSGFSRSLMLVSPEDDPQQVAEDLRRGLYAGIKVYHCYAPRPDTMNASIGTFTPDWMMEILNEIKGVLMLHIVLDRAIDDPDNQKQIIRLSRSYPNARIILAHVARSFNYRHARSGLHSIVDLDNVFVDTSAVCESETFRAALKVLGPRRVVWGSDFPVSEVRGRCITIGSDFFWLHPEIIHPDYRPPTSHEMTLVGLESLLTLQEACADEGLTRSDIEDIFLNNALRILKPHLPANVVSPDLKGPDLWTHARGVISGGTGLLSKRAEMFGSESWPAYFTRSSGCEVWDLEGRRYIDFAGGIGAVLLGYADEEVTAAIQRRLSAGTYCSLVNPQEVELGDKLLELHPWAGKVRYARGGGEAMSMAVRIARASTGRSGIVFCGYHGWHDWYLAANLGDSHALDGHLLPGLHPKGVPRELKGTSVPFRYNDMASFEEAMKQLGDNVAAVVMEPMRSEFPKDNFIEKVAARCRQAGAVFIVDEITSGLRYGFPGALSKIGVTPDVVVYAKALGNGVPFAAIIGREKIMNDSDDSFISSSYWTDGIGSAAALAVLEKMQRLQVHETVWMRGEKFYSELKEIASKFPGCKLTIGGMPVSPTLTFALQEYAAGAKKIFILKMLSKGFLVSSVIYLMYSHQDSHIQNFLTATRVVLGEMEGMIRDGKLWEGSAGKGPGDGFARLA